MCTELDPIDVLVIAKVLEACVQTSAKCGDLETMHMLSKTLHKVDVYIAARADAETGASSASSAPARSWPSSPATAEQLEATAEQLQATAEQLQAFKARCLAAMERANEQHPGGEVVAAIAAKGTPVPAIAPVDPAASSTRTAARTAARTAERRSPSSLVRTSTAAIAGSTTDPFGRPGAPAMGDLAGLGLADDLDLDELERYEGTYLRSVVGSLSTGRLELASTDVAEALGALQLAIAAPVAGSRGRYRFASMLLFYGDIEATVEALRKHAPRR
jgi:hypothetical protein